MKCLIDANCKKENEESSVLDDVDLDIIDYVAGFVVFRTKKFYTRGRKEKHVSICDSYTAGKPFSKLIVTHNRGGFCQPKKDILRNLRLNSTQT